MKAKDKAKYEAPAMEVVQMQVKASLCNISNQAINFRFDDDNNFYTDPERSWRRLGYGGANEI